MSTEPQTEQVVDWPLRALLAGLFAAALEVAVARGSQTWSLFLGDAERHTFIGLSVVAGVSGAAVVYAMGLLSARLAREPEARARLLGVLAFAVAAVVLYLLTEGRRVRSSPLRVPAVSLLALLPSVLVMRFGAPVERRARAGGSILLALLFALGAAAATLADATLLRRLYPVFHLALGVTSVLLSGLAAWLLPLPTARLGVTARGQLARVGPVALALVTLLALPVALTQAALAPNLTFVVTEYAGFTGRLLGLTRALGGVQSEGDADGAAGTETASDGGQDAAAVDLRSGLRLTSRNVLLITVDALRADRLQSAAGTTPQLDALAAESAVFSHAYTPTPHTSYALSSLLTGKYLRPVLDLPGAGSEHVALPELLRRYGMRTAAFYPPAIFFVDAHRFEALRDSHFGFEYRKQMFAPAARRVPQLREYLDSIDAERGAPRDVFAWVHLFEPHEPYDPDPRFARGGSAEERYDAEVAAADDAIGELVRLFRRYRPGATVIVTADHGEEFGDHGGLYHGSTLYEEQVRVPLIWSSPGLVRPFVSDAPVELVDIATTLLAALAIPRDARMRGDDLGPLLVHQEGGPAYAFAEVGDARMVTDGHHKAICETASTRCQLYDLQRDPRERRNLAGDQPEVLAQLRDELSRFVASIPRVEALALAGAQAWPEALARAELGDVAVAPDLVPLLGDSRPAVRGGAARLLGRLRYAPALATLARVRDEDADPAVREEAALATLALGDDGSVPLVRVIAQRTDAPLELRRRAALALAERGDASQSATLVAWAADASAEEGARRRAITLLGELRVVSSLPTLIALLEDVRLGPAAATALGAIGERRAVAPLRRKLRAERYLPARAAEAEALAQLGDRGAAPLVRRFLGMEQPLPSGVAILVRLGGLPRASGRGLVVAASPRARGGEWECTDQGCGAQMGASLTLPAAGAPRGPVRVVCAVRGSGAGTLELAGHRLPVVAGESQVVVDATGPVRELSVRTSPGVLVSACAVVPAEEELPPPAPEPQEDAGEPAASAAEASGASESAAPR
ncbi:MAG: sulfatase-like hydrolase/transferase [Myxococcales bacterium]|nr:sulfatase-like hydrolase/transferase [Myxococcales bacterium]MCB9627264.1 sulfatase-like hydrolase/transferase [Sandaracinaceae bacterium]